MSNVLVGVVLTVLGLGFIALARWGRDNAETLVAVGLPEARRVKELRSVRRGVRSFLVVGGIFVVNGIVFVVVAATQARQ